MKRLALREASERLGVTVDALRKRIARGYLDSEKGPDGKVYVWLDDDQDIGQTQRQVEGSGVEDELREQVHYLREQLRREQDAHSEARRIIAGLVQRVPELEAPAEPSQEGRDTGEDRPGQEEPAERPWWRRWFGA